MTTNFTKIMGFVIALAASSAQAVPTLYFNGTISYDANDSKLSVISDLIDTADIVPAPSLNGTLNFDAELISTFFGWGYNIGNFGTIAGQNDISVIDADSNVLLTGNFTSLTMSGSDDADSGSIVGELISNGGLLSTEFGLGNVLALEFNLNTTFNSAMFDNDFAGLIDGNIQGEPTTVPAPSLLALLSAGILLIGFAGNKSRVSI